LKKCPLSRLSISSSCSFGASIDALKGEGAGKPVRDNRWNDDIAG